MALKIFAEMTGDSIDLKKAAEKFAANGTAMMERLGAAQAAGPGWSIGRVFEETAAKQRDSECIRFVDTGASYSFADVGRMTDRIAAVAVGLGWRRGDTVGLYLSNRPEVFFLWMGLCKAGIVSALINFNLTGRPLIHSVRVGHCKAVIVGAESSAAFDADTRAALGDLQLTYHSIGGLVDGMSNFDAAIAATPQPSRAAVHELSSSVQATDVLMYMYTSGTTGHPKAAVMTHLRFQAVGISYALDFDADTSDRIYCALPLYHAAGGAIGVGMMMVTGGTLVVRSKFSTRAFWSDVVEHRCTVIQYIGELCRYLLQAYQRYGASVDLSPRDGWPGVRIAIGNGLSPDIWTEFKETFQVQRIGEIYAATETICGMKNAPGKTGAVGFLPRSFQEDPICGTRLIRYNVEEDDVVRNEKGLCIECRPGEVGQLVGKIVPEQHLKNFVGYTDKTASSNKVLKDVFEKGDSYFLSGDLLRSDNEGFFYFVDRIGDTFRWKGENVSTGEVAMVLNDVPGVVEANVYGVKVPHTDGRAGMAALSVDEKLFSLSNLYEAVERELPSYARPLFVRMLPAMEVTSTFKLKKHRLRKEGIDVTVIEDTVYIKDTSKGSYEPLTIERFKRLVAGGPTSRL